MSKFYLKQILKQTKVIIACLTIGSFFFVTLIASAAGITPVQSFVGGGILGGAGGAIQNLIAPSQTSNSNAIPPLNSGVTLIPSNNLSLTPPAQAQAQAQALTVTQTNTNPTINSAQANFYNSNQNNNTFGANLFTGAFSRIGPTQFNPDYMIAIGDSIQVRLWGNFQLDSVLNVDPKGNIYIPNVGPVHVLGIKNQDVQHVVESAISKVFRSNVLSYSSLAAAQPVRVFVGGYVNLPGMYSGTSMDSLLSYLDQAGGIDVARGSFIKVEIKRGELLRATFNLYEFLLNGKMPVVQLADGDVILVTTRNNTFTTTDGLAENPFQFEFTGNSILLSDAIKLSKPFPQANHVMITRNDSGAKSSTEYYPLSNNKIMIYNGDVVQFTSDKKIGTISVKVQGEHESEISYVLPYGARLGELMHKIQYSERSDQENIQLFRQSVKQAQAQQIQSLIQTLQSNLLTSRSGTSSEETLRSQEAARMLQWVANAKQIQPTGQVLIAQTSKRDDLLLENGDVINIPTKNGLVNVTGLVLFPTSIAYDQSLKFDDYIKKCGGYTQNSDQARIIVSHLDGSFSDLQEKSNFFSSTTKKTDIREGDIIMVLPFVDPKLRQYWLEMSQIIAQIAITSKIVLGL